MKLRSFKLRFVHRHVRIELAEDDRGQQYEGQGFDLSGAEADAALALGAGLRALLAGHRVVRALSVDLHGPVLLASLEPPAPDAALAEDGGAFEGGEALPERDAFGEAPVEVREPSAPAARARRHAVRLAGPAAAEALAQCAPLLEHLEAAVRASLDRRARSEVPVRAAGTPRELLDWELTLTASGVPHQLVPPEAQADEGRGWTLRVPQPDEPEARRALDAFDAENAPTERPAAEAAYGDTLLGAVAALLLLAFFLAVDATAERLPWFDRGSADAAAIVHGGLARTATALTLHADPAHVVGNAAGLLVLLPALARRLGPAAAAWVTLGAGVCGNWITALCHRARFVSLGASTSVFGVLGALAAVQLLSRTKGSRRRWLSLGAAAALLGTMGAGEHADLLAHLFGTLCGGALGAVASLALPGPPRRTLLQPALAAGTLAALTGAWVVALH